MKIRDVEWRSGADTIVGHLYIPDGTSPFAGVVLCHGFAGVKELLLPAYAERFASAGFAALTFDYRGFGASQGERGRIIPERQIEDIQSAIGFLSQQPEVAPERIALWGTSLGGANAVVAASRDDRIKCLSVQLAFANGERVVTGNMSDQEKERFLNTIRRLQERRARTGSETMVPLGNVLTDPQSAAFYERFADHPALDIEVPMLTVAETLKHKPEEYLPSLRIPLLVVGAGKDSVNPPRESELLFEQANEPKSLMMLDDATHYELYEGSYLDAVSSRQIDWFAQHL
jgi:alpha-beta hydrolase superfamily lysophospholipase